MKRGELMEYKGRTIYRWKKGCVLILHKDGQRGYASSVRAAKAAINAKEKNNEQEDNLL